MPDDRDEPLADEETSPKSEDEHAADDAPGEEEAGEKGLGTESGAAGGGESAPNNPDPSTKGATKGTEGAL